ncbi:hypothetical protein BC938DRAFT_475808 [Jimgerdemannia flammicorona]|uniref:DUF159-domain-containing protein n=1 Tax=Jimgerdemannia flammicorona TaxID=994334 RepID=A0A433PNW5_9FUNG|nr:hypothetical protein BC938DRAFT_475808 [Jimgerdemannia flammicorona]
MCGRLACALPPDAIKTALRCSTWIDQDKYKSSYNVAPTSFQPVVREDPTTKEPFIHSMKWGLIPSWSTKQPEYQVYNCPCSTPSRERSAASSSRKGGHPLSACLEYSVLQTHTPPLSSFYEWLAPKHGGKHKKPYFTRRKDGQLMLLAGLYDVVKLEGESEPIYSYTIVTTSSSPFLSFLHDRMPVILENNSEDVQTWLDPSIPWGAQVAKLLKPYEGELECYPVKHEVGKVGTDSPDFIIPLSETRKTGIDSFFKPAKATDHTIGTVHAACSGQMTASPKPEVTIAKTEGNAHGDGADAETESARALERALRESQESTASTVAKQTTDNGVKEGLGDAASDFSRAMDREIQESCEEHERSSKKRVPYTETLGNANITNDQRDDVDAEYARAMEWALRESREEHERVNGRNQDQEAVAIRDGNGDGNGDVKVSPMQLHHKRDLDEIGNAASPVSKKPHLFASTPPSKTPFLSPPSSPSRARPPTSPTKKTSTTPKKASGKDRKDDGHGSAKITSFFQRKL